MNAVWKIIIILALAIGCGPPLLASDDGWPRDIPLEDGGTVTVYEPQVDSLDEQSVSFRAALAYREKPGANPVFGAGWFESDVQVDRLSRTAHPIALRVTQTRFPVEEDVQKRLGEAMAEPGFASQFTFSLDELEASMAATQAESEAARQVNTTPPRIIYRDRPALLVTLDGQPILRDIEQSDYEAVINTPYPLIRDGDTFYLNVARDVWYQGRSATGPFRYSTRVPPAIEKLVDDAEALAAESGELDASASTEKVTAANAPEIVVTTEPAELVVTDGPAAFVPLVDDLLVLNNSDDDVFLHLGEQRYYIVLAGRWYRASKLDGPWEYREATALPTAFANIPQDSEQAESRVYVAGTEEAQEAVLDAQVPQTAAVKRGEADIDIQYDGEPEFASVDGTDMDYAVNSGSTVILSGGLYYLVEDGVWYVSTSPNGPWQVAVARPDQVRVILPSSPVYNVKYVYVYGHTPDVVYVGYTPGYLGSYVYGPTVVYGTGWYYRPWATPYSYYPRPYTWGFNVSYNNWYGWSFGLSWAWGPFRFSYWPGGYWHRSHYWHHRYYSYWGPCGYRPRYHHGRPPHAMPYGGRHGGGHGARPYQRHHNLYRDSGQHAVVADTRDRTPAAWRKPGAKGDARFYAKNGQAVPKRKAAYASAGPVGRDDLAQKARARNDGFVAAKDKSKARNSGKAFSKGHAGSATAAKPVKTPDRKVTRGDLSRKAKAVHAGGQEKSAPAQRSKQYALPAKTTKPVTRKQPTRDKAVKPVSAAKLPARTSKNFATPPSKTVVKGSSRKVSQVTSKSSSAATSAQTRMATVKTQPAKSRAAPMPKVRLTQPRKPASPAYSKQKATPAARQMQAPAPRASSRPASSGQQAVKAKPSRQAAPARNNKQKAQKSKRS